MHHDKVKFTITETVKEVRAESNPYSIRASGFNLLAYGINHVH